MYFFLNLLDTSKDPIARKLRLRRGRRDQEEADQDQAKILKGMKDIAKEKNNKTSEDVKVESLKYSFKIKKKRKLYLLIRN